jgi:predicted RNase H-like nuclease
MPKISSMDWILIAAHDMSDALNNPHPDVPFDTVRDDTIKVLTTLSAIFKNKLKKPLAP